MIFYNKDMTISDTVGFHTIQKSNLVSEYVKNWSYKLLGAPNCSKLVYIDCMCNNGLYYFKFNTEEGTPIKVVRKLCEPANKYRDKEILVFFNDNDEEKINQLRKLISERISEIPPNIKIEYSSIDASDFLKSKQKEVLKNRNHSLLFYDPYKTVAKWDALKPYLNTWGEVIINHMTSDPSRGIKGAKIAVQRYEEFYNDSIDNLKNYSIEDYHKKLLTQLKEMISVGNYPSYISWTSFFNEKESHVYDLIYVTKNLKGLVLYKRTSFKIANGQTNMKHNNQSIGQISLDLGGETKFSYLTNYTIDTIAKYLVDKYRKEGQLKVLISDVWKYLDLHPVFPSEGYKAEYKSALKALECSFDRKYLYIK